MWNWVMWGKKLGLCQMKKKIENILEATFLASCSLTWSEICLDDIKHGFETR